MMIFLTVWEIKTDRCWSKTRLTSGWSVCFLEIWVWSPLYWTMCSNRICHFSPHPKTRSSFISIQQGITKWPHPQWIAPTEFEHCKFCSTSVLNSLPHFWNFIPGMAGNKVKCVNFLINTRENTTDRFSHFYFCGHENETRNIVTLIRWIKVHLHMNFHWFQPTSSDASTVYVIVCHKVKVYHATEYYNNFLFLFCFWYLYLSLVIYIF